MKLVGTVTGRMCDPGPSFQELPKTTTAQGAHMNFPLSEEDYAEHRAELQEHFRSRADHYDVFLGALSRYINSWMDAQGFWDSDNRGEKIALMHSELSEALEAIRNGDEDNEAEELADALIRILDYCGQFEINIGKALCDKMQKNLLRPRKHGKAF